MNVKKAIFDSYFNKTSALDFGNLSKTLDRQVGSFNSVLKGSRSIPKKIRSANGPLKTNGDAIKRNIDNITVR